MARIVPPLGREEESLLATLERHRAAILWELDGLDEAQLRTSGLPSGLTPIDLVQHLAAVEYGWFCATFGRAHEPLPFDLDDESADVRVGPTNPRPTCSRSGRGAPRPRTTRWPRSNSTPRARPGSASGSRCGG